MNVRIISKYLALGCLLLTIAVCAFGLCSGVVRADATAGYQGIRLNVEVPGFLTEGEVPAESSGFLLTYMSALTKWIGGILGMVCVVIFIFSGFQIVTSAGSSEMVGQAKERIMNTIFGLLLLITSALILHTINPGFFRWSQSENDADQNAFASYYKKTDYKFISQEATAADWREACEAAKKSVETILNADIQACTKQYPTEVYKTTYSPADISTVTIRPTASENKCTAQLTFYCSYIERTGASTPNPGDGDDDSEPPNTNPPPNTCSDPAGHCSSANMGAFGSDAELAAQVCKLESSGNASALNARCLGNGSDYSVGLFQLNLLWNGTSSSGKECAGAFERDGRGPRLNPCVIIDPATVADCVAKYSQPASNINAAADLSKNKKGWNNWSTYGRAKACFESA